MKQNITPKRVIALLVAAILPILVIALGCFLLFADTIFNVAFAITYVIIPLVSITLLTLIVFSVKKAVFKVMLTIIVVVAFIVLFLFSSMIGNFELLIHEENTKIAKSYAEVCNNFDLMPTLEDVGSYTNAMHYDYSSSCLGIFTCDADTLMVYYDSDEYQKQKALLDDKYVFQKNEMTAFEYSCSPFVEINGYSFRVLDISGEYDSEIYYPKSMVFIAVNDQNNSISYTAFYNDDLDYIESLEEFLLNDCGWKHILKHS